MSNKISKFTGKYSAFSNYETYPISIKIYNETNHLETFSFTSNEAAFQSCKTKDLNIIRQFTYLPPNKSKSLGRYLDLRTDWEYIKYNVMYSLVFLKFVQNPMLIPLLLNTENIELIEGNTWHDNYWGSCTCSKCENKGENKLGEILMNVRGRLSKKDLNTMDLNKMDRINSEYLALILKGIKG